MDLAAARPITSGPTSMGIRSDDLSPIEKRTISPMFTPIGADIKTKEASNFEMAAADLVP